MCKKASNIKWGQKPKPKQSNIKYLAPLKKRVPEMSAREGIEIDEGIYHKEIKGRRPAKCMNSKIYEADVKCCLPTMGTSSPMIKQMLE